MRSKTGLGILSAFILLLAVAVFPAAGASAAEPLKLDASAKPSPVRDGVMKMGTSRTPDGHTLAVNTQSLVLDGKPWLPVMGEIHYARLPQAEWRDEILKMKAGGIDIVATYVFWIHHEEIEGQFDWTGQRSLRDFVALCGKLGMRVVVRCGPWCHGEVRNGGLPDWVVNNKKMKSRSNDPAYLEKVKRLYGEIAGQLKGQLWKDGGPVIGIQLENEFSGAPEHLLTLKRIAREAGLDVPIYNKTGWPNMRAPMPYGEMLPLYGAYADGFWDREIKPTAAYDGAFMFTDVRTQAAIGSDQLGKRKAQDENNTGGYPYLACEIGGGMASSYHRRIRLAPADTVATALVKIGSGNNMQGYYMYHGGTNPEGKLSTLNESQATNFWNDLPVKTYDFQAPLGEFGQVRETYHRLRLLHLFLRDYGPALATMPALLPDKCPAGARDTATLRWTARTDGKSGFVFVSNYQRFLPMPAKEGVQFELRLAGGSLRFPTAQLTVPADSYFFWPFNLDLGGVRLIYATAQPICQVEDQGTLYVVFTQTPGVSAEFVFDAAGAKVMSAQGRTAATGVQTRVSQVQPGTGAAIRLTTAGGKRVAIVLLDEKDSLNCWKGTLAGRERILLSRAALIMDGDTLRVNSTDPADLAVAILPAPASLSVAGAGLKATEDGVFRRYAIPAPQTTPVKATWEQVAPAGPARKIAMGSQRVAEQPSDADFAAAAVWRVKLPAGLDPGRDLLLRVRYTGDVARACLGDKLLTDNFYDGNVFDIGLKRYASELTGKELQLNILPLSKGAPIYLPKDAWPDFGSVSSAASLNKIEVIERHEVRCEAKP